MANLHFGHAFADARIDRPQVFSLLSNPGHDAGRADQRRAEKIAQSLRGPILGYELLDIEIDRRGPDALAILSGRDHSHGKRRLCLAAAMRAAVDRGLMFRNHERALGKVEHLALLDPDRRLRFERRTAMAAGARLMPNHMIGIGGLPQRAALVALLPAARLARAASQAARDPRLLLQPVARRRLGTVRTVLSQLSTKISDFSLEYRDLVLQRSDQLIDFGGKIHPTLDSDSQPQVSQVPLIERKFAETVVFRTHPTLGVTIRLGIRAKSLILPGALGEIRTASVTFCYS
jgi:hypothetical protein